MKISTIFYVTNLISITKAKKSSHVDILFSKRSITVIKFLTSLNYILKYNVIKKNSLFFIRVYVTYYNNKPLGVNFKLISKPSHRFYISIESLKLISKRTGCSTFLLSTSTGLLSHSEALKRKTGGILIGFFSY